MTNVPRPQDDPALNIENIGRIATPGRIAFAAIPSVGIILTPVLPFAVNPTMWFGVPAVLVWIAVLVALTVVALQLVDRGIVKQSAAHATDTVGGDR